MRYLEGYLQKIKDNGNNDLAKSISYTADSLGKKYLEKFSFINHEIGLLFGNVQSGKTAQMFGVMCKATDLGFSVFILLTTDNVVLQQQTLERVKSDLAGFCICGENDAKKFTDNNLIKPVIIVLKKNSRMLKFWLSVIESTEFMRGNPLFIVDDEADAASLNTMINKNRQSTINKYLEGIKASASSSMYLQVTGTPQALLLQAKETGWHPYFTYYFRPGSSYLGGDFFFSQDEKPQCITLIDELENPLLEAVLHHLATSAQMLLSGRNVCNFMIHPSVRISMHSKYKQAVEKILLDFKNAINSIKFKTQLGEMVQKTQPLKDKGCLFVDIYRWVQDALINGKINIMVLNGKTEITSDEYASGSNIIIGGNTLGRGVTFGGLQTIYYTRSAKKPQADTMWQHSRMFGYDRDSGMMMVYIDEKLYKLFSDINATNNSIISQIEKGIDNVRIYYPLGLNPTRKNVLDNKKIFTLTGGVNYYPLSPDNNTIEALDELLKKFDEHISHYQVSLRLVKEILKHVVTDTDFRLSSFIAVIDVFLAEKPSQQASLIVRRNRDIRKGSGALLSSNDWNIGRNIQDKVVLTMYQMTGDKGWNGRKIWVPNIKLPDNTVYYDVDNDDKEL